MSETPANKFRSALALLQKGREQLVDSLADEILDQGEDLIEEGYRFNEFVEMQGTRIHFLTLLMCQLEQSADALDERLAAPPPEPTPPRRSRPRKVRPKVTGEETPEGF